MPGSPSTASCPQPAAPARPKPAWADLFRSTVPRQHGAWAILTAAVALGWIVGGSLGVAPALLALAAVAGFFARNAAMLALRLSRSDARRPRIWLLTFVHGALCAAAGLGAMIAGGLWWLFPIGVAGLVLAGVGLAIEVRGKAVSLEAELAGIFGLCLLVPAMEYAASAVLDTRTLGCWVLALLFFAGRPLHVRFISKHRDGAHSVAERLALGWPTLLYQATAAANAVALSLTAELLPPLAPLALVPGLLLAGAGIARRPKAPPSITTVGFHEVAHLAVFLVLAGLAFH